MKTFSKLEIAAARRTAASVKNFIKKRNKLLSTIKELDDQMSQLNQIIDSFENPIKELTGGYTSSEVLQAINNNCETETEENVEITDNNVEF